MLLSVEQWMTLIQTIAVVGGLVGLYLQLRSMDKSLKSVTYQTVVAQVRDFHKELASCDEISSYIAKHLWGNEHERLVIGKEPARYIWLMISYFNFCENLFLQYKNGFLPKHLWYGWAKQMQILIKTPEVQWLWEQNKQFYWPDYVNFIEDNHERE